MKIQQLVSPALKCVQQRHQQQQQQHPATREIGSTKNNSNKPYIMSRYYRQRSVRLDKKEYYIQTFCDEAITNNRVAIFAKNKTDLICKKVEGLFISNIDDTKLKSEMIVYHLDELPYQGGEKIQNYLRQNHDSSTTENCYVFIRGTHVPLAKLEETLGKSTTLSATKTSVQSCPSFDDIHCSSVGNSRYVGSDNSSWFYPETDE
mmetsp:Transcript_22924/g.25558  ORF Transcript_22924/g.25558 Transcript_22924/m.25558 type:complete len:205 (-) Transcript_22924:185-799(-)